MTRGALVQDEVSVTLVNNTLKTELVSVPTGEEWVLEFIDMHNGDNVTRDIHIELYNSSNRVYAKLLTAEPTTTGYHITCPTGTSTSLAYETFTLGAGAWPIGVVAGNRLRLQWSAGGASAGGTAYYTISKRVFKT